MTISFGDLYCIIGEYFVRVKKNEEYAKYQEKEILRLKDELRVIRQFLAERDLKTLYDESEYYINNCDPDVF